MEFLRLGFKKARLEVSADVIEEAVDTLDGMPSWLTFFGNEYVRV